LFNNTSTYALASSFYRPTVLLQILSPYRTRSRIHWTVKLIETRCSSFRLWVKEWIHKILGGFGLNIAKTETEQATGTSSFSLFYLSSSCLFQLKSSLQRTSNRISFSFILSLISFPPVLFKFQQTLINIGAPVVLSFLTAPLAATGHLLNPPFTRPEFTEDSSLLNFVSVVPT
jgi:hypothetical protein